MIVFPISSIIDYTKDVMNATHTIDGVIANLTGNETTVLNDLEDRFSDFINALPNIVTKIKIDRILQEDSDKLIAIRFSFDYITTYCDYVS